MLNFPSDIKIYLCTGKTDMRKGINGLSLSAQSVLSNNVCSGAMFVFRGGAADKIKILWHDGQGFCLFYKILDRGKFPWSNAGNKASIRITGAQLSMLMEGIDWRNPRWSKPPEFVG
jgi:transposase